MKKILQIILIALLGALPISASAKVYIYPHNIEAGESFNVIVLLVFSTSSSAITNVSTTISGTTIAIDMSAKIGYNTSLDADKVVVSIPPLPAGNYTITTTIDGLDPRNKQFSIPYEGFWNPAEIESWNWIVNYRPNLGEPVDPDTFFSNPNYLYAYARGGNQVNDPNLILPTLTNKGSVIEYMHPKRKNDANLIYQVETRTNLTVGTWTTLSSTPTETITTNGICDEIIYSIPTTNSQAYIRLNVSYQQ